MTQRTFTLAVALMLVMTALIGFNAAGSGRALETHEIFVAQTSREMIANRDLIVPTFGGEIRLKKPPLAYWTVAAVAVLTGQPDVPAWVARTPSVLSAVILVLATTILGCVLYNRQTGLLAGSMLAFSTGVYLYSSNARPEMLYAACTGVMTLGFAAAWQLRENTPTKHWASLGWVGLALALLAKGPQIPLLVLVGLSLWAIYKDGVKGWYRAFRPLTGLGIVVLIVSPWLIAVLLRVDDAFAIWKHELIGLRFEPQSDGAGALAGVWAWFKAFVTPEYLLFCVTFMLPWGALLFMGLCAPWTRRKPEMAAGRPLWVALLVTLIGLSIPTHWRDYYLLPALPILSVLIASGIIDLLEKASERKLLARLAFGVLGLLALIAVGLAGAVETMSGVSGIEWAELIATLSFVLGVVWFAAKHCQANRLCLSLIASISLWGGLFFVVGNEPMLWSTRHERIDTIALAAAEATNGGTLRVVSIGFDPDDLIYRVNHPIVAVPISTPIEELLASAPMVLVVPAEIAERVRTTPHRVQTVLTTELEDGEWFEVLRVDAERTPLTEPG